MCIEVFNDAKVLSDLSGLTALQADAAAESLTWDDDDEDDFGM